MSDAHEKNRKYGFRHGDLVTVRSLGEILDSLDPSGKFEGLAFMPEMAPYCGKTFRIYRRAEKTCVEGVGMRAMKDTVFLENLRCDGSLHDGCQRNCLFFWKEAWLRPAENAPPSVPSDNPTDPTLDPILAQRVAQLPTKQADRYFCQSTELLGATLDFPKGKLAHYLNDFRLGEITLPRFSHFVWMALANRFQRLVRGRWAFQLAGEKKKTQAEALNLQPGEWVEIKSPQEIKVTLDEKGRNRGLSFEPEMALLCGKRFRVAKQLHTIITEENGKLVHLTNTVILEGLTCQGICTKNCPRANFFFWREIWLKRV